MSASQNEGFVEKKMFFDRTKNLLPFDSVYEKTEENGFYQQK